MKCPNDQPSYDWMLNFPESCDIIHLKNMVFQMDTDGAGNSCEPMNFSLPALDANRDTPLLEACDNLLFEWRLL